MGKDNFAWNDKLVEELIWDAYGHADVRYQIEKFRKEHSSDVRKEFVVGEIVEFDILVLGDNNTTKTVKIAGAIYSCDYVNNIATVYFTHPYNINKGGEYKPFPFFMLSKIPNENPDVRKDWEIVQFTTNMSGGGIWPYDYLLREDGLYYAAMGEPKKLDQLISHPKIDIHQVRRMSDDTVWTVGEREGTLGNPITRFTIKEDGSMWVNGHGFGCPLSDLKKLPPPRTKLFTTEDGVDIFDDKQTIFSVNGNWGITSQQAKFVSDLPTYWKHFSSKEKREEYILMNKPCLSVNDVMDIFRKIYEDTGEYNPSHGEIQQRAKELAQSKLK